MITNEELGRIWKVVDMTYFKVLPQYLPGGTEETMRTLINIW
jgi:hypothetical protein